MTKKYLEALEAIERAVAPDAAIRLTLAEIAKAAGMSPSAFSQFRDGTHAGGQDIRPPTLARNADRILAAIAAAEKNRKEAPLAYVAYARLMQLSKLKVQDWIEHHRGAYFCYRFTSTERKIQVSRLDIFEDSEIPRFRQTFRISNPIFGEPKLRISEGFAFPTSGCAHLICTSESQMYHYVVSNLKNRSPAYMTGVMCGQSVDGDHLFAARFIAIKFGDQPEADLPHSGSSLGVNFQDEEESRLACCLNVELAGTLPTIAGLLSLPSEPGVLRAGLNGRSRADAPSLS